MTQSIDYARTRSKATIVAEYGEEALLRPDLLHKRADGTSLPSRVTYSSAQADLQQQEKKRTREETGAPEPAAAPGHERPAKTARTDDDDDDGAWLLASPLTQPWKLAIRTMSSYVGYPCIHRLVTCTSPSG